MDVIGQYYKVARIESSIDSDLGRMYVKVTFAGGEAKVDPFFLTRHEIHSLTPSEYAQVKRQFAAAIILSGESIMTDLSSIQRAMQKKKMLGMGGSTSSVSVLSPDQYLPAIQAAKDAEKGMKAIEKELGADTIREHGRAPYLKDIWAHPKTPSIVKIAWEMLEKGDVFPVPQDYPRDMHIEITSIIDTLTNGLSEMRALRTKLYQARRDAWASVGHGLYIQTWRWELLVGSLKRGLHTLLVGPPGTAKTETGRALAHHDDRVFYHMEVSGFSEVSQLEYERIMNVQNGQAFMELRPTPWTQAMCDLRDGKRVMVFVDEIKRVSDPSIINPWLLALAQNEYHSVVTKDIYRWAPGQLVVFASANDAAGFNFSGNSRRGMDDAMADRFNRVEMAPPPEDIMVKILADRFTTLPEEQRVTVAAVYGIAQGIPDMAHVFGVRGAMRLAQTWDILGADTWELEDILKRQSVFDEQGTKKIMEMLAAQGK